MVTFVGTLREVQRDAVKFLYKRDKIGLFSRTGVGKTIIMTRLYTFLRGRNKDAKFIIFCEKSQKMQWISELSKFVDGLHTPLKPSIDWHDEDVLFYVEKGTAKQRMGMIERFDKVHSGIMLLNYYSLLGDYALLKDLSYNNVHMVFDEASMLTNKNKTQKNTRLLIKKYAKKVVMLTATPMSKSPDQFYRLMEVLGCNLGKEYDFIENYCEYDTFPIILMNNKKVTIDILRNFPIFSDFMKRYNRFNRGVPSEKEEGKFNYPPAFFSLRMGRRAYKFKLFKIKVATEIREDRLELLKHETNEYYFREEAGEKLHDAEAHYKRVDVTMSGDHHELYSDVKELHTLEPPEQQQLLDDINYNGELPEEVSALTTFSILSLLVNSPYLISKKNVHTSPKRKAIKTLLEKHVKDRNEAVIIFVRRIRWGKYLNAYLKHLGYRVAFIDGSSSSRDRLELKDKLDRRELEVVIGSSVIVRGLNLQSANVMITADLPVTVGDADQLFGRIDRVGQKAKDLFYYFLITEDTFEEKLYETLERRFKNFDSMFNTTPGFKSITNRVVKLLLS